MQWNVLNHVSEIPVQRCRKLYDKIPSRISSRVGDEYKNEIYYCTARTTVEQSILN